MEYISLTDLPDKSVSHNPNIKKKLIIANGKIPRLTNFAQASFASGQISPAHSHSDMWEVFYAESGSGIIKINDQEYKLEKGITVIVEPEEKHEIINNSSAELIISYFGIMTN